MDEPLSMPQPDPIWESALTELTRRTVLLRERPFSELAQLPAWSSNDLVVDGATITYVTYRVTEPDGRLRLVVQANREGKRFLIFGTGQVFAEGFHALPSGSFETIAEHELYAEYI
jgi:hypothetical protein